MTAYVIFSSGSWGSESQECATVQDLREKLLELPMGDVVSIVQGHVVYELPISWKFAKEGDDQ